MLFLSPVALDLGGRVSNGIAAMIAIGIWSLSVILATLMEKNNLNGPLEILLRRLVYKHQESRLFTYFVAIYQVVRAPINLK